MKKAETATTKLQRTFNLNDWLNTVEDSVFVDFEQTDEYAVVIDEIFENIERNFTPAKIEEFRELGVFSGEALDAIEDLLNKLESDEFLFNYRLPSPQYENRYWVFENDEFAVMKVTSYEIVEGIELVMYTAEDGDLDDLPDYLPDNYDGQAFEVWQIDVADDRVLTWDEWRELREEDKFIEENRGNYHKGNKERYENGLQYRCKKIMKEFPDSREAFQCKEIVEDCNPALYTHLIVWPIIVLLVLIFVLCRKWKMKRKVVEEKVANQKFEDNPPNYNVVLEMPPQYEELAPKYEEVVKKVDEKE